MEESGSSAGLVDGFVSGVGKFLFGTGLTLGLSKSCFFVRKTEKP